MSHFYGVMSGQSGEVTRCGSRKSGLRTTAASWAGAIVVDLSVNAEGKDVFTVRQIPWKNGAGINETIAEGVIGEPNYSRELAKEDA